MAKQRKRRTFAVIVEEVRSAPPRPRSGRRSVRPGEFNGAGELFDPSGHLVTTEVADVHPAEAQQHLAAGALVAHEVCGCGGYYGCQPDWYSQADRARMLASGPPQDARADTPTWIDLCAAGGRLVLFLHGDVVWGDVTAPRVRGRTRR